jgi:hypothetical protein
VDDYKTKFKCNDKERDGSIKAESPCGKISTDLKPKIIQVNKNPNNQDLKMDNSDRPVSAYQHNKSDSGYGKLVRPSTGYFQPRMNLKKAVNLDKLRSRLNISEKCSINSSNKEYFKPNKNQVHVLDSPVIPNRNFKLVK